MAEKTTFAGKAQMILEPREKYHRKSNIGSAWTEVRLGMLFTVIDNAAADSHSQAELVANSSYLDYFCFGLMNDVADIPGVAGVNFVGIVSDLTNGHGVSVTDNVAGQAFIGENASAFNKYLMRFASLKDTGILTHDTANRFTIHFPIYNGSNYAAVLCLKLVVSNRGASNQTIQASLTSTLGPVTITPATAIQVLRTALTNSNFADAVSAALTWNSGGAAIALPDSWIVRSPFLTNRLRLAAHEILVIS
jgi:hypothetical protein